MNPTTAQEIAYLIMSNEPRIVAALDAIRRKLVDPLLYRVVFEFQIDMACDEALREIKSMADAARRDLGIAV